MNKSICLMEFSSIAKAFSVLNELLLNFPVDIFLCRKLCPGKHIVLLEGNEHDIDGIEKFIKDLPSIIYTCIKSVSPEVVDVLRNPKNKNFKSSISVIEFKHCVQAIKCADLAVKKYGIIINRIDFSLGMFGKGVVYCSGINSELEGFKNYINDSFPKNEIVGVEVISRPVKELIDLI